MNTNKWNKCADVIHRLSSRIDNEQNQSAMVDNCNTMIPLCIDKTFYQCKNDIGQECCVEVYDNCSDPISNCFSNHWQKSICNPKLNQQYSNHMSPNRHQFTSSHIFHNKNEYIESIVTNVLCQVVNHIPFDCLQELSCYLPQHIERILCNTNIDSDRLIRALVTEILRCYGTNTRQLTDWYAFANSIKPLLPLEKGNDAINEKANHIINKMPSKLKKLSKHGERSERILNSHIKSSTPVPPMIKKEQSSKRLAFSTVAPPSINTSIPSVNRTPSTGVTPEIMSAMNNMTPMSLHSKEEFTPTGTKYQSKSKTDQTFVFDKNNEIDHHESLPFHEKSANRLNPHQSEKQHQIVSNSQPHSDYKSNKSSDQSSSSDCVLTIHHKHKYKKGHHHHQRDHLTTTTTSFDTPLTRSLSSHISIPIKESVQKYKQMSADVSAGITDKQSAHTISTQNMNFNSTNIEQLDSTYLFNDKQMFLSKLIASSDSTTKHLNEIDNSSFQSTHHQTPSLSADNLQLPSPEDLNKSNVLLNDNHVQMNKNSILSNKKSTRINHYPNMLADFD